MSSLDSNIDLFCRTENQLCRDDYGVLNESSPPSLINTSQYDGPRNTCRGGGLLINPKPKLNYNSVQNLIIQPWKLLSQLGCLYGVEHLNAIQIFHLNFPSFVCIGH